MSRYTNSNTPIFQYQDWEYTWKSRAMDQFVQNLRRGSQEMREIASHGQSPLLLLQGPAGTCFEALAQGVFKSLSSRGVKTSPYWVRVSLSELNQWEKNGITSCLQNQWSEAYQAQGTVWFLENTHTLSPEAKHTLFTQLSARSSNQFWVVPFETRGSNPLPDEWKTLRSKVEITVPSLNERKEDLLQIATAAGAKLFSGQYRKFPGFTNELEKNLATYNWSGNDLELLAILQRGLYWSLSNTGALPTDILSSSAGTAAFAALRTNGKPNLSLVVSSPEGASTGASAGPDLNSMNAYEPNGAEAGGYMAIKKRWTEAFEKEYLAEVLTRHQGNVSAAARESQIDRSNFLRLLRRHGIQSKIFRTGKAKIAA